MTREFRHPLSRNKGLRPSCSNQNPRWFSSCLFRSFKHDRHSVEQTGDVDLAQTRMRDTGRAADKISVLRTFICSKDALHENEEDAQRRMRKS